MSRTNRTFLLAAGVAAWAGLAGPASAQQVTGLYNTGVDDAGAPLGDLVDDPHYTIDQDPSGLGDATVPADGFPIPPWAANTPVSRWIGPNSNDADGPAGEYVYRTAFDLSGDISPTFEVRGFWATDDPGIDIRVNGNSTFASSAGFTSFTPFTIPGSSLSQGANTLEFVVSNGGGPTGLHVTNLRGRDTANISTIPGLFNTGVDDGGNVLFEDANDTHYAAVAVPSPYDQVGVPVGNTTGASGFEGPGVVATSAGGFPIPPWVADNATSTWITPGPDTSGPGGNYAWRTTFDLTGFDPDSADIFGQWSSDNGGVDILVNGVSTGQTNPGQFAGFSGFIIPTDLLNFGENTIDFIVNNGANEANEVGPTGVRVEFFTREALPAPYLVADVNGDGVVSVADVGILATNFGLTLEGGRSVGDLNLDGSVTVADVGILATFFGQPNAAATDGGSFADAVAAFPELGGVPEPGSLGLLAIAGIGLVARRRRRHS